MNTVNLSIVNPAINAAKFKQQHAIVASTSEQKVPDELKELNMMQRGMLIGGKKILQSIMEMNAIKKLIANQSKGIATLLQQIIAQLPPIYDNESAPIIAMQLTPNGTVILTMWRTFEVIDENGGVKRMLMYEPYNINDAINKALGSDALPNNSPAISVSDFFSNMPNLINNAKSLMDNGDNSDSDDE